MVDVDSGVAQPKRTERTKYPFADMHPGASFAIPVRTKWDGEKVRSRLLASANYFTKRQPVQMSWVTDVRKEDGELVVRIWRRR